MSRTPSFNARSPRFGSSFAQCFGATAPVSPPRPPAGHASLSGQARGVNYRKLGFEDFEADEGSYDERATELKEQSNSEDSFRRGAILKLGKHSSFKEKPERRRELLYASEGEQDKHNVERKGVWKLGKERARAEKAAYGSFSASNQAFKNSHLRELHKEDTYVNGRQTKPNGDEVYEDSSGGERRGQRLRKESKREVKAMKEGMYAEAEELSSPRRASFGTRMKDACVQVLETARRSSPHVSELFVGNLLLMQVTSSSFNKRQAKHRSPSYGFHEFTGDPSFSSTVMSSPANSTSSAF